MSRSLCVLLNAKAQADAALGAAIDELRRRGHRVEAWPLRMPSGANSHALRAAKDFDVVVSAGGDGMLNETVNGVLFSGGDAAVTTLAYGTANDFANATGLAGLSPLEALTLAAKGPVVRIDVGKCNERHFINVASGGFGAEVTAETPRDLKAWLGGLAYTLTGMMKYLTNEERFLHIQTPALEWSGCVLGFTVANSRLAGGGYVVAPEAKLDDGLLDLHLVPPSPVVDEMAGYIEGLFGEEGLDATVGEAWAVPWCDIRSRQPLHVNLDGEPVRGTSFRFEALPRRLRVILPGAVAPNGRAS